MPNWVRNVIEVWGKPNDVADFVEKHNYEIGERRQ